MAQTRPTILTPTTYLTSPEVANIVGFLALDGPAHDRTSLVRLRHDGAGTTAQLCPTLHRCRYVASEQASSSRVTDACSTVPGVLVRSLIQAEESFSASKSQPSLAWLTYSEAQNPAKEARFIPGSVSHISRPLEMTPYSVPTRNKRTEGQSRGLRKVVKSRISMKP